MNDQDVRMQVAQAEQLLAALDSFPDPKNRATAVEAVQVLLELYGEGLARMLARASKLGDKALLDAFIEDELISHLLLVHDLHPEDIEARVQRGLDEVHDTVAAHGGQVELLRVEAGVAHLRLSGSCNGCSASITTLRQTIERAIEQVAPDLVAIEMEGEGTPENGTDNFIPISALLETNGHGG